jgi:hypothetical protein
VNAISTRIGRIYNNIHKGIQQENADRFGASDEWGLNMIRWFVLLVLMLGISGIANAANGETGRIEATVASRGELSVFITPASRPRS